MSATLRESAAHTAECPMWIIATRRPCGGWLRLYDTLHGVACETCDRCGYRMAVPRKLAAPPLRHGGGPCVVCTEPTPRVARASDVRDTCSDLCFSALLADLAAGVHKRRRERRAAA